MSTYRIKTQKTWDDTMRELSEAMRKWGVETWNAYALTPATPNSPVRLTFKRSGKEVELTMSSHLRRVDNLRVLYLGIEAMRLNQARGIDHMLQDAYTQLALPKPSQKRDAYQILGVRPDSDWEVIEAAYRAKARKTHPDAGGSDAAFKEVQAAYETIKKERT